METQQYAAGGSIIVENFVLRLDRHGTPTGVAALSEVPWRSYEGLDLSQLPVPAPIQSLPRLSCRMTFTPTDNWWDFVASLAAKRQQEDDEDGGMHAVGVQMLVGYEEGQFTVDDILGVAA